MVIFLILNSILKFLTGIKKVHSQNALKIESEVICLMLLSCITFKLKNSIYTFYYTDFSILLSEPNTLMTFLKN